MLFFQLTKHVPEPETLCRSLVCSLACLHVVIKEGRCLSDQLRSLIVVVTVDGQHSFHSAVVVLV